MSKLLLGLLLGATLAGCSSPPRLTTSSGFSFAQVDTVAVAKATAADEAALYGLDIQLGNLLSHCQLHVVGEKDLEALAPEARARALVARLSLVTSDERRLLSLAFDGAASHKTLASLTVVVRGDLLDARDRRDAFEPLAEAVIAAVERDKGVEIED